MKTIPALMIRWMLLSAFSLAGLTSPAPRTDAPALNFVANIETAGVLFSGEALPASAELFYRAENEAAWRPAHRMVKIKDGRLAGSLFYLAPATRYEVKVRSGGQEVTGWFSTQPETLAFTPLQILYVNASAAPGGDGSAARPFRAIQDAVNRAAPGSQISVADGIYRETVIFPNSGAPNQWIQLKAAGSGAILEGAAELRGEVWTPLGGSVWYTRIPNPIMYLARDGQRFYLYDSLKGLTSAVGHSETPMSEGWFMDASAGILYVRSQSVPAGHVWQTPLLNSAVTADGKDWLWVEGFEMRYYGAQASCGICFRNSSHLVIRNNRVHHVQKGIFIEWSGGGNLADDVRIEYNEIYDPPVDAFPWRAAKGTSMEGTAILLRGHTGAIARGNLIHHFFNGIYTGSSAALDNPALAFDADVYGNSLHHISDDALEPEGACVNHRFRNNVIASALVGVSLAPISIGPVWVLRNTVAYYTARSVKFDGKSDGYVFYYHNSSWTNQPYANAIDVIAPVHNTTLRNNIFEGRGYAFREIVSGSSSNDWNFNNWYTTYAPRYRWENRPYNNIAKLCAGAKLVCNGVEKPSAMKDPASGNFALLSSSPNIDRGAVIAGINDAYVGNAPDLGAVEYGFSPPATFTPQVFPPPATLIPPSTPTPAVPPTPTSAPVESPPALSSSMVFPSIGTQDGWILESGEFTRKGGAADRLSPLILLGDDGKDRQYVGILSFDTSALPPGVAIQAAQLNVKQKDALGANPLETHGALLAEILNAPFSGNSELVAGDFSAAAAPSAAQERLYASDGWLTMNWSSYNLNYINPSGLTQIRLFFSADDNDDGGEDALRVFSGNAEIADQPQLIVTFR